MQIDRDSAIVTQMEEKTVTPSWPNLITLLSDLVVFQQYSFKVFLQRLITIAGDIAPTDSCFIYIRDRQKKVLLLVASKNPQTKGLGEIHLAEGEGITGWVAEHKKPVAISEKAYEDKRFKFFQELPEDKYESFLSIPILDAHGVVGVMNFQDKKPYVFSSQQITVLESIGKIVSSAFVNAALSEKVLSLEEKLEERKTIEKAKGVLMKIKHISEEQAFTFLRKEAMNKRTTMKKIAESVLLLWQ